MKKATYFVVFIVLLVTIISGCDVNATHNANRELAEEWALRLVRGQTYYPYHTIERTTYDRETGNFTVYISCAVYENDPIRVVIRINEDGSFSIINHYEVFTVHLRYLTAPPTI